MLYNTLVYHMLYCIIHSILTNALIRHQGYMLKFATKHFNARSDKHSCLGVTVKVLNN